MSEAADLNELLGRIRGQLRAELEPDKQTDGERSDLDRIRGTPPGKRELARFALAFLVPTGVAVLAILLATLLLG